MAQTVVIDRDFADALCSELGGSAAAPSFGAMLDAAARLARKRASTVEGPQQNVVATRAQILANLSTTRYQRPVTEGMDKLRRFERFLEAIDKNYMCRSIGQREFHRAFTIACLPHIVGEGEWEKHRATFLKHFMEDEFKGEVLVTTPRRFGKTTAVAMFVSALLVCCDRMWCSIFSTGKRASKSLLVQIKEVLDSFKGLTSRIVSSNVEELLIQPIGTSGAKSVSRCYSYPSSVKGLKGVSAKVIVMEEASRLDTNVFYEVVVPLLGVSNTAVLGISTPLGDDNYYSQLTQIKDENDKDLFRSLSIELICPACKAKDADAAECVHRLDQLPAWKSEARQEKVKRIMSTVPELYMREALGVTTSEKFGVYTSSQVSRLQQLLMSTPLDNKTPTRDTPLFVVVDPTGGGSSKMALMSFACHLGKLVLIGMENSIIPRGDVGCQADLVSAHMKSLRALYPHNRAVLITEANMSWVTASHFAALCAPFSIYPLKDKKTGHAGVITTSDTKENGVLLLQASINAGIIVRNWNRVFSVGETAWKGEGCDGICPEKRFDIRVNELVFQLSRFKKQIKQGRDNFQEDKFVYSGKDGVNQDDLCMCLMIAVYWIQKTINSAP